MLAEDRKAMVERFARRQADCSSCFHAAADAGDWEAARKVARELAFFADHVLREWDRSLTETDALEAELLIYRPRRCDKPAAPLLDGYCYVSTGGKPWVCVVVERVELVEIPALFGDGYRQRHCVPERKTLCGGKTAFPVSERFGSGGWPRLHELCPDCTTELAGRGLLKAEEESVPS